MNKNQEFKQVKRVSVTELVAESIQSMIASGKFKPGDKLPSQKELEQMMSISRPTLREAMSRLIVSDIIEARQGQGYFVKEPDVNININCAVPINSFNKKKIRELFEARLFFEASLAQLTAIYATDEEIDQLLDYIERSEKDLLTDKEKENTNYFHQMVADFSHNTILASLENSLLGLFSDYDSTFLSENNQLYHYKYEINPHRKIAEAIQKRDPYGAYTESFKHIINYTTDIGIREKYQNFIAFNKKSNK